MPRKAERLTRQNTRTLAVKDGESFLQASNFDPNSKRRSKPVVRLNLDIKPFKRNAISKVKQQIVTRSKKIKAKAKPLFKRQNPVLPQPKPKTNASSNNAANNNVHNNTKPTSTPQLQLPIMWKYQSKKAAFALQVSHSDGIVAFGDDSGAVVVFNLDGKLESFIQLPAGVKTLVADRYWLYAGCDNGAVYDLTNRKEPRAIYTLPPVEELLMEAPSDKDIEELLPPANDNNMDVDDLTSDASHIELQPQKTKHVVFVLDVSGSMSGIKIQASLTNMFSICENHLKPSDKISFIKFNQHSTLVFREKCWQSNETEIKEAFATSFVGGSTALYDAIANAYEIIQNSSDDTWIIALTDGRDNGSKNWSKIKLKSLIESRPTNFVAIMVGGGHPELQDLCASAQHGSYIQVSNTWEGIHEAFKSVAQLLSARICYMSMADGLLSVGDRSGNVIALSINGDKIWSAKSRGKGGWMVVSDPRSTYHGHTNGVTKYNLRNGNLEWDLPLDSPVFFGYQKNSHNTVYCASGRNILQIDKETAAIKAKYTTPTAIFSNAVSEDGSLIFAGEADGYVTCFAEGNPSPLWRLATGCGAPLAMQYLCGRLFIATTKGTLACIDTRPETIALVTNGQQSAPAMDVALGPEVQVTRPLDDAPPTNDTTNGIVLECTKELTDEECLIIHNAIHNPTLSEVTIRGVTYPIKVGPTGCRFTSIVGMIWIEQNKSKRSKFAEMAQQGHKITWTITGARSSWGLVIDGVVKHNATRVIVVPVSTQYRRDLEVQFPAQLRKAGIKYVVEGLELAESGTHYRPLGSIRRVVELQ